MRHLPVHALRRALRGVIVILVLSLSTPVLHAQWQRVNNLPPGYDGNYWLDVFFLPSNPLYGWISGNNGRIMRTRDGGLTWEGILVRNLPIKIESIQFLTARIGYCTAQPRLQSSGTEHYVYKSVDGGVTWLDVTPPGAEEIWGLYFLNANLGIVCGGGCGSQQAFYRTNDGGANWTVTRYNQANTGLSDPVLFGDGSGYASSSGAVWRTSDYGRNWDLLSLTGGGSRDWQEEISVVGSSILVPYSLGCTGDLNTGGGIRFTDNLGQQWWEVDSLPSMFGAFLMDAQSGWACGLDANVWYTTDGGRLWYALNRGIAPTEDLDDMWFVSGERGFVVGTSVYRLCLHDPEITSDGGLILPEGGTLTLDAGEGYDSYQWSTGASSRTITVSTGGTYSVTVGYNLGCTGYAEVEIDDRQALAEVYIPALEADPRDRNFRIPVLLRDQTYLADADPTEFRTTIHFNATLFFPASLSTGSFTDLGVNDGDRIIELRVPVSGSTLSGSDQVLTEITGAVLLGNSSSTPLSFEVGKTEWSTSTGMDVSTLTDDGLLSLIDATLCEEGGTRLLTYPLGIQAARVHADRRTLDISARVTTDERLTIAVHSLLGQTLCELPWHPSDRPGNDGETSLREAFTLPLTLSPGMYMLSLQSDAHFDSILLHVQ